MRIVDKTLRPKPRCICMPFLRYIALLTLPALLLGLSGFDGANLHGSNANEQVRVECQKVVRLAVLARVEQIKTVAAPDCSPGKTPINWLPFTAPVLKTTWRIVAVVAATHVPHFAPSLTGIVELQI